MEMDLDEASPRSRVAVLLKEFSTLDDAREPWRTRFPLAEVLLLLTCATIAECDDFDDIVAWGEHQHHDRSTFATRVYICSAPLDIERIAHGARGHWGAANQGPDARSASGW